MAVSVPKQIENSVKDLYLTIERNFSKLIKACETEAQCKKVIALHSSARDAFWKSVAEALEDNNLVVKEIHKDLKKTTKSIKEDLKDLQDIVETLKTLTAAVRLAGSIVALAAV